MSLLKSTCNLLDKDIYDKMRRENAISAAIVNVTDNCNLRCPYCFTEHNTRVSSFKTMQDIIYFIISEIERVKNNGIDTSGIHPSLAFFGGEPMLHYEDIIKPTIEWAKNDPKVAQYNFGFSITTNGTLFNTDRIKYLYDNNVGILLSIDGGKFTQDDQRPGANGQSSFDMIEPHLKTLLNYFPNTTFRSTLEPRNAGRLLENYLFARETGFSHYFVTPNVYAKWTNEDIAKAIRSLSAMINIMFSDIEKTGKCCNLDFFLKILANLLNGNFEDNHKIELLRCGIGTISMGVACNGDIKGCQEHNTYIDNDSDIFYIGNIYTGIDEVKHRRLLGLYMSKECPSCSENPELCKDCEIKQICAANFCPSANMGKNDNVIENSYISCMWSRLLYQLGISLIDGFKENGMSKNIKDYIIKLLEGRLI